MNALTFPLLRFLADGRHRSFADISAALGVSAEQIAATLDAIVSQGVTIERNAVGCKLKTSHDWLDAAQIASHLGQRASAFRIEVVDHTGSTNDDLIARAGHGAGSGLVRVAEFQTAGRGRRQRDWHAGLGGALTFSLLWIFTKSPAALSGLSLAVGVSLVRCLQSFGTTEVALKWPNDVLWRQRKLGGILIETAGSGDEVTRAVIGIGLNVNLSGVVAARIDQDATDLQTAGIHIGRNELLGRLLLELRGVLASFAQEGFAPFRQEWEQAHAHQDKMVQLDLADGTQQEGRVIGVDDDGALLLAAGGSTRTYHGGELSLRPTGTWPIA